MPDAQAKNSGFFEFQVEDENISQVKQANLLEDEKPAAVKSEGKFEF